MAALVKIAHISDIHLFGKHDYRHIEELERLLDHFNTQHYQHLVISGDLGNNADPEEWFLIKKSLDKHGWFSWEKTTLIPGNHDIINLEEEMRFYNALNPLPMIKKNAFERKVQEFCLLFQELITSNRNSHEGFPFIKVINYPALRLAIAAFNSLYPWYPTENPLGARGYISPRELQAMRNPEVSAALKECCVIGLCHHAYKVYGTDSLIDQAFDWTMELKNREAFLEVIKLLRSKIVLHGHFHRFQRYNVDGITFINGGSFRYNSRCYSELLIESNGSFTQQFITLE